MSPLPIICIPHGGGPLPLLDDPGHLAMTQALPLLGKTLPPCQAIVLISAHWEGAEITIGGHADPPLIYDYRGFPPESYAIEYPAPGDPAFAERISRHLSQAGISNHIDAKRGLDHGIFVPMKLMVPDASIPIVPVSIRQDLSPSAHHELGAALAKVRTEGGLIIGSGMSFHNLSNLIHKRVAPQDSIDQFNDWLVTTLSDPTLSSAQRHQRWLDWQQAPGARIAHPREEHLIPFITCSAAAGHCPAELIFDAEIMAQRTLGALWN